MQPAQARRNRQSELCAGTEPRMARRGGVDAHAATAAEHEQFAQALDVEARAFGLGAGDGDLRRGRNDDARAQIADGKADATEAPPQTAVEIEEPKVQTG